MTILVAAQNIDNLDTLSPAVKEVLGDMATEEVLNEIHGQKLMKL